MSRNITPGAIGAIAAEGMVHKDAGVMVRVESREMLHSTGKHVLSEEGEKTRRLAAQSMVQQVAGSEASST